MIVAGRSCDWGKCRVQMSLIDERTGWDGGLDSYPPVRLEVDSAFSGALG